MKAISIRQPWAFAIVHLGKRIENRPKFWHYRGPICIHASKIRLNKSGSIPPRIIEELDDGASTIREIANRTGVKIPLGTMTYRRMVVESGAIVGTANLVACVRESKSPWFFGPYGLVLEDVKPTPIIPCGGALGPWDVPPDIEKLVLDEPLP